MRGFDPAALVAAREAKGWNAARLAREADIGLSTLRYWERGAGSPEPDNLARVADALGVPVAQLVRVRDGAQTLADARVLAGLTQPQLGRLTGISTTSIGALERAEIRLSEERAQLLADALDLSVDDIKNAYAAARDRADDVP